MKLTKQDMKTLEKIKRCVKTHSVKIVCLM